MCYKNRLLHILDFSFRLRRGLLLCVDVDKCIKDDNLFPIKVGSCLWVQSHDFGAFKWKYGSLLLCCACHMFWRAISILVVVIPWLQFNIRPSQIADVWFPLNWFLLFLIRRIITQRSIFYWAYYRKWISNIENISLQMVDFERSCEGSMSTDPSMAFGFPRHLVL